MSRLTSAATKFFANFASFVDNNSLLRGKIRYLSAMQRLKGIFWTAMVLVIFAGGVWLGFTVRHWLKPGSGLREENTATGRAGADAFGFGHGQIRARKSRHP